MVHIENQFINYLLGAIQSMFFLANCGYTLHTQKENQKKKTNE